MLVWREFLNDFYALLLNDCGFDDVCSFRSRFGRCVRSRIGGTATFFRPSA